MHEAHVAAVHRSGTFGPAGDMAKDPVDRIELLAGLGVADDAHAGERVRHRPAAADDPDRPNDRQVHLIANETYDDLQRAGHTVEPGDLGENVTTTGVDLLSLPVGTVLRLGSAGAAVRLTGKRHPRPVQGEYPPVLTLRDDGVPSGPVGVFGVVERPGPVTPGDVVAVEPGDGGPLGPV
jgi:MOSC domain-containing protein YiiM